MLKITIKDKETGIDKDIQISRTLGGDYLLREHPDLDIIVMPGKSKVLVMAKEDQSDYTYIIQEKLFDYMVKSGVILPETVIAGNVYGSLQGNFVPKPPGGENPLQVVIYSLANFIEKERPAILKDKELERDWEKSLLKPDTKDSTELGEVPAEEFKGSIPIYGYPTRGVYRYNY